MSSSYADQEDRILACKSKFRILARLCDEKQEFLTPKGVALGPDDAGVFDSVLEEREFDLRGGAILVFNTDDFMETRTMAGKEFI